VAEGVKTARAARDLAQNYDIAMPIVEEVYQLLYEAKDPNRAVQDLMNRELKGE
jgi:glycerol-3-phosphate dehydrogenase (NAD(P)+)